MFCIDAIGDWKESVRLEVLRAVVLTALRLTIEVHQLHIGWNKLLFQINILILYFGMQYFIHGRIIIQQSAEIKAEGRQI